LNRLILKGLRHQSSVFNHLQWTPSALGCQEVLRQLTPKLTPSPSQSLEQVRQAQAEGIGQFYQAAQSQVGAPVLQSAQEGSFQYSQ
jgi:hypothetical protein